MGGLFTNWNFPRILRLLVGIFVIYDGIMSREYLIVTIGFVLATMAVLNYGCCGVANCKTAVNSSENQKEDTDIIFEEVK